MVHIKQLLLHEQQQHEQQHQEHHLYVLELQHLLLLLVEFLLQ
jgi:hypothetical protein